METCLKMELLASMFFIYFIFWDFEKLEGTYNLFGPSAKQTVLQKSFRSSQMKT